MLVDPAGQIIWHYGKAGVTGSGADELNTPVQKYVVAERAYSGHRSGQPAGH